MAGLEVGKKLPKEYAEVVDQGFAGLQNVAEGLKNMGIDISIIQSSQLNLNKAGGFTQQV